MNIISRIFVIFYPMKEPRTAQGSPILLAGWFDSVEVEVPLLRLGIVDPRDDATVKDRCEGERTVGLNVEDRRDPQLPLELNAACQRLQSEGLTHVHLLGAVHVATDHPRNLEAAAGSWAIHDLETVHWNVNHEIERADQSASGHDAAFL